MPHYWLLIEGENPSPAKRASAVKKATRDHGATLHFVGKEETSGRWYALVETDATDGIPLPLRRAIKVRRSLMALKKHDPDG